MIKYYAYYNHGGYKDLYLGSNEDTADCRYFLPMLTVYEKDESMKDTVEQWKSLPRIVNLSNDTAELNYPAEARTMISHAGYKLQYRTAGSADILAIRDIAGNTDSYGRSCKFVMMFVADTAPDKRILKSVTYYSWKHLKETESFLCTLFVNDFDVNGLRFNVRKLTEHISDMISCEDGSLDDNTYNRKVQLYIVPDGMKFRSAFEEQQLSPDDVSLAYNESSTKIYRYKHSDETGFSVRRPQEQETNNFSLRSTLGLSKEEDLRDLVEAHRKLCEKVEQLENRIKELENRLL